MNSIMKTVLPLLTTLFGIFATTCSSATIQSDLIVYHAGSLTLPFKEIIKQFNEQYPEITVISKAGGSTKMARLISEKREVADLMASADYTVINNELIPDFADWNVLFATNRLVLCYTDNSKLSSKVDKDNWYQILQNPEVQWGHTDPNLDPCGYRSLMLMQLAEKYYAEKGLYEKLLNNRSPDNVFSKASSLVSMLISGKLDYGWEYLSVAVQNNLRYVELPDQVNLGSYQYDPLYAEAHVQVTGKEPNTFIELKGKSITYGITMLKDAPHREAAEAFLQFMLAADKGLKILGEMGQPPFSPPTVANVAAKNTLPSGIADRVSIQK